MEEARREGDTKGYKRESIINAGMPINLVTYEAVGKFKSVRRAIRRGLVSPLVKYILGDLLAIPIPR